MLPIHWEEGEQMKSGEFGIFDCLLVLQWGEITFSFSIFLGTIKFVAGEIFLQVEVKLFVEFFNCLLYRFAHSQISRRKINFKNSIILVTKPDRELVMGRNLI